MPGQSGGKGVRAQIGEFRFAQCRERIEALKFCIDESRMAHDEPAVRKSFQKTRKERGKIGSGGEIISAGEGRIGCKAEALRLAAETEVQQVESQSLAIAQLAQRVRAPALPDPRLRHGFCNRA